MPDSIFDTTLKSPRDIPQVEQVAGAEFLAPYIGRMSRPYVLAVVRGLIDETRERLVDGEMIEGAELRRLLIERLDSEKLRFVTRVVNATGIVIHTNLGRSPLGRERAEAIAERLWGYSNLEYDIERGKRGKRGTQVTRLFELLSGAEASCIVNNNAAAVYLILDTFAKGRECVVSRSELVQIGGGFRMPDVMKSSGAILREVGTTNKVSYDDYCEAVTESTGLIAKIHWSNFKITGFTQSVEARKLAQLGKERGIPVMYDLGSGSWISPSEYGVRDEPSIMSALNSGVDLVCFSGDKLLGGPQAGVILGKREYVEKVNKNPMYRALRPNKITLYLMEQTLLSYLRGDSQRDIPAVGLLMSQPQLLKMRAESIAEKLAESGVRSTVVETTALAGGGSAPEEELKSFGVRLEFPMSASEIALKLRKADPPIIGRIIDDRVVLDLKSVFKEEDSLICETVARMLRS